MMNKEFYKATFSQVHGSVRFDEIAAKAGHKKPVKLILMLAAAICLLAAFSSVAAAKDWFGIRQLEITETIPVSSGEAEVSSASTGGETDDAVKEPEAVVHTGIISLQGYEGSPEKMATTEWRNFLASYDDGGALERIGNNPTGFEEKYGLYNVYTQEMADKLDEITEKYCLALHESTCDIITQNELCKRVGGDFLGENQLGSAYIYADGTFQFDGEGYIEDYGILDYQFRRTTKGIFDEVVLNTGNISDYQEWNYTTACGETVILALGDSKALIVADLDDAFVVVNILAGTYTDIGDIFSSGPFTAEFLEAFADSFDFSLL